MNEKIRTEVELTEKLSLHSTAADLSPPKSIEATFSSYRLPKRKYNGKRWQKDKIMGFLYTLLRSIFKQWMLLITQDVIVTGFLCSFAFDNILSVQFTK